MEVFKRSALINKIVFIEIGWAKAQTDLDYCPALKGGAKKSVSHLALAKQKEH